MIHENRRGREAGGAIHWRSWNLRSRSKEEIPLLIEIGSIISGRAAVKHDFSTARMLAALYRFSSYSRTHWRDLLDRTRVVESCRYTFQVETILISFRMLVQFEVNLGGGIHCWVKRKPRRTTNCVLHSPGSLVKRDWRNKSNVTCRNQERYTARLSGNAHNTPCVGSIWPGAREKRHNFWANKNRTPSLLTRQCRQMVLGEMSQKGVTFQSRVFVNARDSPRFVALLLTVVLWCLWSI